MGIDLVGGVNPRGSYVSKILYVKMKETGPWGGGRAPGTLHLDPPVNRLAAPMRTPGSATVNCMS